MFKATKFMLGLVNEPGGILNKTSTLLVQGRQYTVKHYRKNEDKKLHTVVVIGGFSVYGYKDDRINALAQSIANVGCRAMIVAIPDIENLIISSSLIDETVKIIKHICDDSYFAPTGKVSILAPSFSAGLVLNACSNRLLHDRISAICCIGTYADIQNVFDYAVGKDIADDYGRNILLKNFIPHSSYKDNHELLSIVNAAIYDNGFKRKIPQLPNVLMKSSVENLAFWKNWQNDSSFRMKLLKEFVDGSEELKSWIKIYNIKEKILEITSPVVFIHGNSDTVIPKSESVYLHQLRIKNNFPSMLCTTNLISHGDRQKGAILSFDYVRLSRALSYFFKYAKS